MQDARVNFEIMSSSPRADEWSNEKTLKFIDLLSAEPAIWDPKHKHHKLKHKVHDAWVRLGEVMNIGLEELKAKKKSLMASFRPLVHKKKASLRSGSSSEDVYQPTWFAYDAMELFLGSIYDVNKTMNTEDDPEKENENTRNEDTTNENTENIQNEYTQDEVIQNKNASTSRTMQKKRRLNFDINDAQKKLNNSFETLNSFLSNKRQDEDDCDLYAKLLATKLRKIPDGMRQRMMYKIDGLLLEHAGSNQQPLPFCNYTSSPSPSPTYILPGSPTYTIPPPPANTIQQSPVYTIQRSPANNIPPSPVYTIPPCPANNILPPPAYTIPPYPANTIQQSPVYTVQRTPANTINIPEDSANWHNSESILRTISQNHHTSETRKRIKILSEEIILPVNDIIETAFLNSK